MHSSVRANYLASPPLVIAYAIAGRVNIDFEREPIGFTRHSDNNNNNNDKQPIFLRDIWPTRRQLHELEVSCVLPEIVGPQLNSKLMVYTD